MKAWFYVHGHIFLLCVALIAATMIGVNVANKHDKCEAKGGTYVRTTSGYKCVRVTEEIAL